MLNISGCGESRLMEVSQCDPCKCSNSNHHSYWNLSAARCDENHVGSCASRGRFRNLRYRQQGHFAHSRLALLRSSLKFGWLHSVKRASRSCTTSRATRVKVYVLVCGNIPVVEGHLGGSSEAAPERRPFGWLACANSQRCCESVIAGAMQLVLAFVVIINERYVWSRGTDLFFRCWAVKELHTQCCKTGESGLHLRGAQLRLDLL